MITGNKEFDEWLATRPVDEQDRWEAFAQSLTDDTERAEYINATLIARLLVAESEPRGARIVLRYRDSRSATMDPVLRQQAERDAEESTEAIVDRARQSG